MRAILLLCGFVAGIIVGGALVLAGLRVARPWGGVCGLRLLRGGAMSLLGGALGVYAFGVAFVGLAELDADDGGTDSAPAGVCREANPGLASRVTGHTIALVPLDFRCRVSSGSSYSASVVPEFVSPVAGSLLLLAVGSGAASLWWRSTAGQRAISTDRRGVDDR